MAVSTVSTYATFQSTLNDVAKVQNDLSTEQQQLSSGNAAQYFTDMAGQTQQFLSLSNSISKINQYAAGNQVVESRVSTTNTVLTQVINVATSLQGMISQRMSGVATNSAFFSQIQGLWQQLVGQLNTQIGGQYLFSGTATSTPAVDANNFPTLQQSGTPDAGYYLGSQQDMTARADDNISITYNVRADAAGFQNIFAAFAMAKQGDANNNTSEVQTAENLVQTGIQGVTTIQATVNSNQVAMNTIDTNHQTLKLYWQGLQQSIGNTDIVAVSTQVAVDQGILQAAFQAFAKINALQLSNYLK
ncbi:MAG: hypothetical protein KGJ21_03205 [Pseudomonadota bacterium]|nr:hypothetical protein [Pseudomonadota bacterium]